MRALHLTKRSDHFLEDPSEPPIFRARLVDYRRSGYDRGSMDPYWNWAHDKSSSKLKVRGRDAPSAHYLRLVSCE